MVHLSVPLLVGVVAAILVVAFFVGRRWKRRGGPGRLELASLLLLVFAAIGVRVPGESGGREFLLVDVSFSTGERAPDLAGLARRGALDLKRTRVFLFGERVVPGPADLGPVSARSLLRAGRGGTNLGAALRAILPKIQPGSRVVVTTDGRVRAASLAGPAAALRSRGATLAVLGFGRVLGGDARVDDLLVPGRIAAGEGTRALVSLAGPPGASLPVHLMVDGRTVRSRTVELPGSGQVRIAFSVPPLPRGDHDVAVRLEPPPGDPASLNDGLATGVVAYGGKTVLVVGKPSVGRILAAKGFRVRRAEPDSLPSLAPFDLVVLSDVRAPDLSDGGRAIAEFVRSGGGLLVIGGPHAYGPGGYSGRPIEDVLPVRSDPGRKELTVVLLLDRSGSMGRPFVAAGAPRIALAIAASRKLLSILPPRTRFLFVPFSDTIVGTPLPVSLSTPEGREKALAGLARAGEAHGGTVLTAPLRLALDTARSGPGKCLVLLATDGRITNEDPDALVAMAGAIRRTGAKLAVLAIGKDANLEFLDRMVGQGERPVVVSSGREITESFVNGLLRLQGEKRVLLGHRVVRRGPGPGAPGRGPVPDVFGLVRTWPTRRALVWWETRKGVPVVAAKRYGMGESVAVTTDPFSAWAPGWAASGRIADLAEWAARPAALEGPRVRVTRSDGRLHVDVYAGKQQAEVEAAFRLPGGQQVLSRLPARGPGVYSGDIAVDDEGAAFVSVKVGNRVARGGFTVPWPSEYGPTGRSAGGLAAIRKVFGKGPPPGSAGRDASAILGLLALLSLLAFELQRAEILKMRRGEVR